MEWTHYKLYHSERDIQPVVGAQKEEKIQVNCTEKICKKVLTVGEGVWYYNKAVRAGETAGRARTLKIEQHYVSKKRSP